MAKKNLSTRDSDNALRLNAVFDTAVDGIIIIDDRGIIELVNEAAAQLFGYQESELIGNNVSMLMPLPYRKEHDGYIKRYHHTGEPRIIGIGREVEGMRKDGSVFPFRLSISEVYLQEEDRKIFTGMVHDLTEQKRAEEELRAEKEKAQMYFDLANTINVVLDERGQIVKLNRKGCQFINRPQEDVAGQNWFDLILPPDTREKAKQQYARWMEAKEAIPEYQESQVIDHDGRMRYFTWRSNVLRGTGLENVIGMITAGIDITEQREAEERILSLNAELEDRVEQRTEELAEAVNQLLSINKKLEHEVNERRQAEEALRANEKKLREAFEREKELSRLKSRFVSMASHEFRTPLSTILSSADLIEAYTRQEQQEKRSRHTNRIKSAVANLTGILNDFLSLSKLEEGKIACHPVEFEMASFCQDVVEEMQGLLKPGQEIRLTGVEEPTLLVLDKKLLRNVFYNLLSNAIKYSGPNQPIDCDVSICNDQLKVSIKDRGIGIPEEEQQHLFSRFFRAHNVENIQGTGLGLNIVKRYVELMDGQVSFESKENEGTTFYVIIPLKPVKAN